MADILNRLGVDQALLIEVLLGIVLLLIIAMIVLLVMNAKMYRRYDFFMRGKDAESMEDMIVDMRSRMHSMLDQEMDNRDRMKRLQYGAARSYQKTGIVKYNAFEGMGGKSSFVLALLDQSNNGVLLNAMHSRTSCYLYIKEITDGKSETELGREEQEALNKALNR